MKTFAQVAFEKGGSIHPLIITNIQIFQFFENDSSEDK
jgi:hypothetical protein